MVGVGLGNHGIVLEYLQSHHHFYFDYIPNGLVLRDGTVIKAPQAILWHSQREALPFFHFTCPRKTDDDVCDLDAALCIGEGNGTPLQYSYLENPMDGGAWWAAVQGVAMSRARLSDFIFTFHFHTWRRKWQPSPVFLAWRIPGARSLMGCCLQGRTELDTTEAT